MWELSTLKVYSAHFTKCIMSIVLVYSQLEIQVLATNMHACSYIRLLILTLSQVLIHYADLFTNQGIIILMKIVKLFMNQISRIFNSVINTSFLQTNQLFDVFSLAHVCWVATLLLSMQLFEIHHLISQSYNINQENLSTFPNIWKSLSKLVDCSFELKSSSNGKMCWWIEKNGSSAFQFLCHTTCSLHSLSFKSLMRNSLRVIEYKAFYQTSNLTQFSINTGTTISEIIIIFQLPVWMPSGFKLWWISAVFFFLDK